MDGQPERAVDDPQSWLAEGSLPEMRSPLDWLDKGLLQLDDDRVRSVTVHHADGEVVSVSRRDPTASDFELADLLEGELGEILLHTSYFDVDEFHNLFAAALVASGDFKPAKGFKAKDRASEWLAGLKA